MTQIKTASEIWIDPDDVSQYVGKSHKAHDVHKDRSHEDEIGGQPGLRKRGRPKLAHPKHQVSMRLDQAVVEHFKAGGPGWQSRINAALRSVVGV